MTARTLLLPWAWRRIAPHAQNLPSYGTDDWHQLPDRDPARLASGIFAAESWRLLGTRGAQLWVTLDDGHVCEHEQRLLEDLIVREAKKGIAVGRHVLHHIPPRSTYLGGPVPWEPSA
jgi:hypothetical protein